MLARIDLGVPLGVACPRYFINNLPCASELCMPRSFFKHNSCGFRACLTMQAALKHAGMFNPANAGLAGAMG